MADKIRVGFTDVDKLIKYCTNCRRCWEFKYRVEHRKSKCIHYDDFPSYGKPKVLCPSCLNKGE